MSFEATMQTYFRGEKLESFVFIAPFGLLCIAFAIAILYESRTPFSIGLAIPFLVLGAVLLGVGLAVGLRTDGQLAALNTLYASDKARFLAEELPRMQKVNAAWPTYIRTWCSFLAIGIVLRFIVKQDWAFGFGVGLIFFGAVGLIIDGFAERRAVPYTAALKVLGDG
jgi:hypothetical protein